VLRHRLLAHDKQVTVEVSDGLVQRLHDLGSGRAIWELVKGMRDRGKTVFLTTHLMEEAERLCDRVAIIEHGTLIEMGTPDELVERHCPERGVVFSSEGEGVRDQLEKIPGIASVTHEGNTYRLRGTGDRFVTDVIHAIASEGIHVTGFRTEFPNLEDVFLKLTGHGIRD
jgi:ABC-2 type transport system ATP-binding protein